ncbi:MAG: lysophospholipid acyltransferase family protein [Patescibacteria group bacterium]|jgi:1-acyl-sn-glycerol-3-phosphate acyltransferase
MVERQKDTIFFHLARILLAPIIMLRIKNITGLENLPAKGPYIIAANHVSFMDPLLIAFVTGHHSKTKPRFISKIELKKYFGKTIGERWFGMIYVEKENPGRCLEIASDHLKQGGIVGIFPEGHRHYDDSIGRGRTGVARLALWAKCPVIPVGYIGPSDKEVKSLPLIFCRKHEIQINFGQPMTFNSFYDQELNKEILHKITGKILEKISILTGKPIENIHPIEKAKKLNKPYIYWHMREVYEDTVREAIRRGTSIELDVAYDDETGKIYVGHPKEYYKENNLPLPKNIDIDTAVKMLEEAPDVVLILDCKHKKAVPKIKEIIQQLGVHRCILHSFIKEWSEPYPDYVKKEAHWEAEDVPYYAIKGLIEETGVKTIGAMHALSEQRVRDEKLLDRAISMANGFESISVYLPGVKLPPEEFSRKTIAAGYLPWVNQDVIVKSEKEYDFVYIGMTDNPDYATVNREF